MLIMSNIFMSTSLLWLAKDAAGCFDEPIADGQCNKSIYGMKAESFITNIATIAAVLAALFMPICGALVDYTPHRKSVGIVTALIMIAIQAAQIGTVEQTWFAMGILQALAAFIYQLQLVVLFAYMPEIAREVGEISMTKFSSHFSLAQYVTSTLFLVVITGITIAFSTSAVVSGQISQGVNTVTSLICFTVGWFKYLTPRPAVRAVPEGHWLLLEGFKQNWRTAKSVQKHYKHGLRYFLLAVVFAEACT
jgi:MFS-type transporter involved in bile tolerance (Atg22 family)